MTIASGADFTGDSSGSGKILNDAGGTLAIPAGTVSVNFELENAGSMTIADGADLANGGEGTIANDAGATMTYPGGSAGATISMPLTNHGTVTASGGTLNLSGGVVFTSGGVFAGGGNGDRGE